MTAAGRFFHLFGNGEKPLPLRLIVLACLALVVTVAWSRDWDRLVRIVRARFRLAGEMRGDLLAQRVEADLRGHGNAHELGALLQGGELLGGAGRVDRFFGNGQSGLLGHGEVLVDFGNVRGM